MGSTYCFLIDNDIDVTSRQQAQIILELLARECEMSQIHEGDIGHSACLS
jgi:hypothetical protein